MKNLLPEESSSNVCNKVTIKNEIIYLQLNPEVPTIKGIEGVIEEVHQLCLNGSGLILVDSTWSKVLEKGARLSIIRAFNEFALAVAFLNTGGILASLMIHFMIKVDKPQFSIMDFGSKKEAVQWLDTFKK